MTQDQTTEQFVTYMFDVVTNDGKLYSHIILQEVDNVRLHSSSVLLYEYTIPDIWKRMATRLIYKFRLMDTYKDPAHVFTTDERDMLADMLAEKYDEMVKEGV